MQRRESQDTRNAHTLKKLCQLVKNGRLEEATALTGAAETHESSENAEKEPLRDSLLFWKGKMDAAAALERYAASEFLLAQWDGFAPSPEAVLLPESFRYALKEFVFKKALAGYLELYNLSGIADAVVLARLGRLYKGLGDYERAIHSYELARAEAKNDPRVIAALADCYALIDESRAAKLFFREAFFLDPEACDLAACEAPFLRELVSRLKAEGVPEDELPYWVPVHATAWGVFNVTRELKPVEIGRLTQSIRELEEQYAREPSGPVKALLLNKYFWLADHYAGIKAPAEDRDDVLRKIRNLDQTIYECYIS